MDEDLLTVRKVSTVLANVEKVHRPSILHNLQAAMNDKRLVSSKKVK